MYKIRYFHHNKYGNRYWDIGFDLHETYNEALICAYACSVLEVSELMVDALRNGFVETHTKFEVTPDHKCRELNDIKRFPVATIYYDRAPWDREDGCYTRILTGYDIVELEHKKYNAKLREKYGDIDLLVKFQEFDRINGEPLYCANKEYYRYAHEIESMSAEECYAAICSVYERGE